MRKKMDGYVGLSAWEIRRMKKMNLHLRRMVFLAAVVLTVCVCFFLTARVDAAVTEIQSNGKMTKAGNYYVKWTQKEWTYTDGYKNVLYRSNSANGKKTKIVEINKRIQFVVTDGKYLYFDTGEETYVDPTGSMAVGLQQKKIKVWKMSIATGKKKALAVVSAKDQYKSYKSDYDGTTITQKGDAQNVYYYKTYGRYVYFCPEADYHGDHNHSINDGTIVQVDLKTGRKKTLKIGARSTDWKYEVYPKYGYENARFVTWKKYNDSKVVGLYYLDLKTGEKKLITKKIENDWSIKGYYVYFFEKMSEGGVRVVRYHMGTGERKNLTGKLTGIKEGVYARPFQNYAEYADKWPATIYYRYYYKSKTLKSSPDMTITVL